uniref:Protein kinase domain-containing protein n=1 Tax=Tetradesmus obliquus TaxID=3088 RepID=A0A383W1M2_TETOB|eukprot:jgi/Sobl393_1/10019/SZX71578.1
MFQLSDNTAAAAVSSRHHTSALAAAIAVPLAAVVLLSAAAALLLLLRKRRRQQQQQLPGPRGDFKQGSKEVAGVGIGDSSSSGDKSTGNTMMRGPLGSNKPGWELTASMMRGPLGGNKPGWELTASRTAAAQPQGDAAAAAAAGSDARIHFGELIGSGSYGIVYKARWAGRQVAVKVIEHDTSAAAAAVTNEIQLLLSFNHPNIVKAHHYVTYTQISSTATGSSSGRWWGSGRGSTDSTHALVPAAGAATGSSTADANGAAAAAAAAAAARAVAAVASHSSGGGRGLLPSKSGAGTAAAAAAAAEGSASNGGATGRDQWWSFDSKSNSKNNSINNSKQQQQLSCIGPARAETWLVTEYCDLGTLHHVVRTMHEADHPPPGQLLSVKAKLRLLLLLRDAAQGLQALHAAHTVHGDLNSRNVLVASSASSPCGMTAKLADLGLSRVLQQHATHRTTQTVGTMSHMAPEVLRSGRLSAASDIYSFGIMLHTVFTGEEAFRSLHYGQFFQTVVLEGQRPPVSVALPGDVLMLMERCWAPDPADRPSADRLLELLGFLIQVRQQNLAPRIS